jgi:nucleoid-associated protein YgaU
MTRENKLALVVGFGLILFVGILISDHFSVARSQATANLANQKIADPLVSRTRDEPDLIALKPPAPQSDVAPAQPAVNPSEIAVNTLNNNEPMSPEQRSMIDRNVDLSSRRTEIASAGGDDAPAVPRVPDGVEPVPTDASASPMDQRHVNVSTVKSREAAPIEIEGFVPVDSETQLAIDMKDIRFHDVRGGESLFAICKDYYNDISLVAPLAKFNKMEDASQIRAGRRLMIPPAEVLGGKRVAAASTATPTSRTGTHSALVKQTSEKTAKAGSPRTYTIKSGDSLSSIAQRYLGDREKWRELHKINRKVIDDPDNLKVGTIIRLL